MGEFIPSTERVRDRFIGHSILTGSSVGSPTEIGRAFTRWLREVQARAWDRCLDEIEDYELNTDQAREGNPYRGESDD